MTDNNLFLVKIGERAHLEELVQGVLYCSPSEKYIKQELELHDKGQGDLLEGKMRIKTNGGYMEDHVTHERIPIPPNAVFTISIENVNNMPIFCMTRGTEKDCSNYISDKEYKIQFSEAFKEEVTNSFKKADSALIICEPENFMQSLKSSIRHEVISDNIRYFDYDILDINMMYFLLGVDTFEKNQPYSMKYSNRHRHLLCKDISFSEQREYRIILLDDEITEPQKYNFNFNSQYKIVDLHELFSGVKIKL